MGLFVRSGSVPIYGATPETVLPRLAAALRDHRAFVESESPLRVVFRGGMFGRMTPMAMRYVGRGELSTADGPGVVVRYSLDFGLFAAAVAAACAVPAVVAMQFTIPPLSVLGVTALAFVFAAGNILRGGPRFEAFLRRHGSAPPRPVSYGTAREGSVGP